MCLQANFRLNSDGESLRIEEGHWLDPFQEPLSPENKEFVTRE